MAVLIRLARSGDAPALSAIYRPFVEGSPISFEEAAPDAAEMERRICGAGPGLHPWMVAEENDRLLGFASSSVFRTRRAYRWTVETGVYVDPIVQGRGVGRSLMDALAQLLERQGFVSAIAAIALPNEPSVRFHEALGFTHSGTYRGTGFKLGEWLDVGLWQRDLAARAVPPREPQPYAAVLSPGECGGGCAG